MSVSSRQRGGYRASITFEKNKADSLLAASSPDIKAIKISYLKLEQYLQRLQEADNEVQQTPGLKDDQIDADIADCAKYIDSVYTTMFTIKDFLEEQASQSSRIPADANSGSAHSLGSVAPLSIKLPKFEMASFDGDPTNWQTFWDVFKVAVHDNKSISGIEKFSYLIGYLEGDALNVAQGYSLTEANYQQVIAALQDRFANKHRAQFAHIRSLINLEPAKNRSLSEVRRICDQFEAHVRSLDALGITEDSYGVMFTSLILTKLPEYLTTKVCEKTGKGEFSLSKIRDWVKSDIAARDMSESSLSENVKFHTSKKPEYPNRGNDGRHSSTTSSLPAPGGAKFSASARQPRRGCAFCSGDHWPERCQKFKNADQRHESLRQYDMICFLCLSTNHTKRECDQQAKDCYYCGKSGHHSSMCYNQFGRNPPSAAQSHSSSNNRNRSWENRQNSNSSATKPSSKPSSNAETQNKGVTPKKVSVAVAVANLEETKDFDVSYLPTAVVTAKNERGDKSITGRALMDSASSRTYVTESFCRKLDLKSVGTTYISVGKFGSNRRSNMNVKRVMFFILCRDGVLQPVLANVTSVISCPVSRHPINLDLCPLAENFDLAEPLNSVADSLELDVLIGSDQYFNFVLTSGTVSHSSGLIFVPSRLGYLTAGTLPIEPEEDGSPESTLVLLCPDVEKFDSVLPHECCDIEKFWKLEDVGTKEKTSANLADDEALRQFNETVKYENGRYYVTWPKKTQNPDLPNTFGLALGRLRSTLRRLNEKEELLQEYDNIIRTQHERGIIEMAPEKPDGLVNYVPHQAVITPGKTTKVRIVYDASAKVRRDAPSFNDCLLRGPVILDDLIGLLLRFRLNAVAIVSDIEKAFLQVRLQTQERDVARFLWVNDVKKPPVGDNLVIWRFASVFFGAISSPFLLGATIDTHLRRSDGDVARNIRENIYVDNVITGEDSDQNAIQHYREAKRLFMGASMNLREFYSNSPVVSESFAPEDRGKSDEPKVLGIKWNLDSDDLRCIGLKSSESSGTVTKRILAQKVAQIYDPCGWFCPVVVPGKLLIQETWEMNLAWDESVPHDISARWSKIHAELAKIPDIRVPRFVGFSKETSLELHAFCDASKAATAVSVYLRKENSGGVECDLMFAKTRLASLKPKATIPCLELTALVMGANMIEFVAELLRLTFKQKVIWSDSQSVLYWLRKEKLATKFVERRVQQIRGKKDVTARFVPGSENPADLPTRGCTAAELMQHKEWWHGPSWLCLDSESWPKDRTRPESEVADQPESASQLVLVEVKHNPVAMLDPQKFSLLFRLLRVTAYVLRYIRNLRVGISQRSTTSLTLTEISDARLYWEKLAQSQGFPALLKQLSAKVLRQSSVAQLNVFRDPVGLLRCRGRLQHSRLQYDAQNPVLLPKNHPFTLGVIRQVHLKNMHAGVAHTLSELRQRYWVPHGRSMVKNVIRACRACRRVEGGPYRIPQAPDLPDFRVVEQEPFATTGLDYLGYLTVKVDPQTTQKVWVCLFTCAASRAIHLELVENQSAAEFHLALRRFFATHGCPKLIVSDNASQFITVETAMKKLWKELTNSPEVDDLATTNQIQWKKIPELSPWMGGFFERLVGIVKKHLKKSLHALTVNLNELRTILVEITAIVNSRPLLYVEDDVHSTQLCPADLLGKTRRQPLPTFAENELSVAPSARNTVENVISRWKRLQSVTSSFWDEWRQGYLTSLREKHANASQRNPSLLLPTVGSVVQIKDKLPRSQWRLGKIEKLVASSDGKVRSVQLRLANARTITRPIKLLYPLEMYVAKTAAVPEQATPDVSPVENEPPPVIPYNAAIELPDEAESEDGFSGFDSQSVADVADRIEKMDNMEKMLAARATPEAAPRPRKIPHKYQLRSRREGSDEE